MTGEIVKDKVKIQISLGTVKQLLYMEVLEFQGPKNSSSCGELAHLTHKNVCFADKNVRFSHKKFCFSHINFSINNNIIMATTTYNIN